MKAYILPIGQTSLFDRNSIDATARSITIIGSLRKEVAMVITKK